MTNNIYHSPVLLRESVDGLLTELNGIYVDVTFGGGGHSRDVLSNLGPNGRLIGFDQDPDAAGNVPDDKRFALVPSNFRFISNHLRFYGIPKVNGILADLGVSSHQFDSADRGFSIRNEAKLDMRMNQQESRSAYQVVNETSEEDLIRIFRLYGELSEARKIAWRIVQERVKAPIVNTTDLVRLVETLVIPPKRNQFNARIFQALRIEVNGEMDALQELLQQSVSLLAEGGRLVVITYHSLEDRMVKRFMQSGNMDGELKKDFYGNPLRPFTPAKGMPIVPAEAEIEQNNRARSAKLRIATRNG